MKALVINEPFVKDFCRTQRWAAKTRGRVLRAPDWLAYCTAVLEEAGIEAVVREVLDTIQFTTPKELVRSSFFLMEAVKEGPPREGRERKWLSFDDAMQELQYKESQWLVFQANSLLQRTNK